MPLPQVVAVEQVMDQADDVVDDEFRKFEKILNEEKSKAEPK